MRMESAQRQSKQKRWIPPRGHGKNDAIKRCLLCGCYWEGWHNCPAKTPICRICGRVGHISRNCLIKAPNNKPDKNHNYKKQGMNFFSGSISYSTERLSPQARFNYYHDFQRVCFYYQHVHGCYYQIFESNGAKGNNREQAYSSSRNNTKDFEKRQMDMDKKNSNFKSREMSEEEALKLNNEAKELYAMEEYKLAWAKYSKLIKDFPKNERYYSNRSACSLMMGNYKVAVNDARKSILINPEYIKGHYRLINCAMLAGKISELETHLADLEKLKSTDEVLMSMRGKLKELKEHLTAEKTAQDEKDNAAALICINKCIDISPFCMAFKLRKAQYLAYMERYDEADAIANDILDKDETNFHAKYILSIRMYQYNLNDAIIYLEKLLRDVPHFKKAMNLCQKAKYLAKLKEQGNQAFRDGKYCEAHGFYARALLVDSWNKKIRVELYNNMGQTSYKLGYRVKSIRECTRALEIDKKHSKALMRRGICYMELEMYDKALEDFEFGCKTYPENEKFRQFLNETREKLEEIERKKEEERKRREKEEEAANKWREEERKRREKEKEEANKRREEERKRREKEEEEANKRREEEWRRTYDDFFSRFGGFNFGGGRERYGSSGGYYGYDKNKENEQNKKNKNEEDESSRRRRPGSGDFYGILGLKKNATMDEVKSAYRKLTMEHHPDRHANASQAVRKEHEEKTKLITQAYRELKNANETGYKFA